MRVNSTAVEVTTPELVTKNLAFNTLGDKRRVRLSSNFLPLMGFEAGARCNVFRNEKPLSGFYVELGYRGRGSHLVHQRSYRRARSNNPFEAVIEFASRELIDATFPSYTQRFHVEMREGRVEFRPLPNRVHSIHNRLRKSSPWSAFVGLTGGVDIHCMEALGWSADIVLEHRPAEARDKSSGRNLSEVHALNTLVNGSPRVVLNEDMYHLEMRQLERILADQPPVSLCHYSLGCDDHSAAKSPEAKQASFEDLSTMYDMVYPMLKQVEIINPAVVLVENVRGFKESGAGVILKTTLRRMGYQITEGVMNALEFGATQSRKRYYLVASIYPGFEMPEPTWCNTTPLRQLIEDHLEQCHDVTDTKAIAARQTKERNMPNFVTVDSLYAPTVLKSQDRGVSDAVYIKHEGRVYKPSETLLKALMSIPQEFNVGWMAKEQATETLGQSIDYKLHHAIMQSVTKHVEANLGGHTLVKYRCQ